MHPLTKQIIASLGDCEGENEYLIKNVHGRFWIEHRHVGSGEPLEQWLDEQIDKYGKDKLANELNQFFAQGSEIGSLERELKNRAKFETDPETGEKFLLREPFKFEEELSKDNSTIFHDEVKSMVNNLEAMQSELDQGLGKSPLEKMEIELQKINKDNPMKTNFPTDKSMAERQHEANNTNPNPMTPQDKESLLAEIEALKKKIEEMELGELQVKEEDTRTLTPLSCIIEKYKTTSEKGFISWFVLNYKSFLEMEKRLFQKVYDEAWGSVEYEHNYFDGTFKQTL